MFTEDVFAFYEGKARFGEAVQVTSGWIFVVALTLVAYLIALEAPQSIFDLATQYAFAGYSALANSPRPEGFVSAIPRGNSHDLLREI